MHREFELRRSDRRTLALELTNDGRLIVRAPRRVSEAYIRRFVEEKEDWLRAAEEKLAARRAAHPEPTEEERKALIQKAREQLPSKVAYYGSLLGVEPAGITITSARTRWGSCSGKNRLSFSWRLMQYPEAAIDYVVVHELAHIRHHDHSPAFYALIESVLPDHKERRALLKK